MQLSMFTLPMLRIMCPQMGEESCLQLLWRAIIVKKDREKVKDFLNEYLSNENRRDIRNSDLSSVP